MKKYRYNIINLDCANCAREIEEELNKNPKLNNVVVNFSTSIISYEADNELDLKELNKLVKDIEPEASVISINEEHQTKELCHIEPIPILNFCNMLITMICVC